jgi:hypothetical protein
MVIIGPMKHRADFFVCWAAGFSNDFGERIQSLDLSGHFCYLTLD